MAVFHRAERLSAAAPAGARQPGPAAPLPFPPPRVHVPQRAQCKAALASSLEALLLRAWGGAALRGPGPWLAWALEQDERLLVAFYIQYLYHGFQ